MAEKLGIGIDLGTANLLVYVEKRGIIFNEPSVVAFDYESGQIVAAGLDAHQMVGKSHKKISVVKPLKNGVISDMQAAKALLTYVLKKVDNLTSKELANAVTVMCCPSEVTPIEREVMIELGKNMGIKDIFIEEEIKAGALGAGIDIFKSRGNMIVDIGGGTTDVGVLSFGDIVLSRTIRKAGNYIDAEIIKLIKKKYKIEIGELTSEQCKIELSDLRENAPTVAVRYAGRDIVKGIPKYVEISSDDIREIIIPTYEEIVKLIMSVLKDTAPELSADIYQNGILLTGGGSLIRGIEDFIWKRIQVPVRVANNPLTCVAEGAKYLLKNRGDYLVNPLQL